MIVVSDTTPLNILAQLGLVDILPELFGSVLITPAVVAELSHVNTPTVVKTWLDSQPAWLRVQAPTQPLAGELPDGVGELEAIRLAVEILADVLLADDKRARRSAESFGLKVTGTLGVLSLAARRGLVDLTDAVGRLRQTNFRISEDLLDALLEEHWRKGS
jgi:predicted nucleic acid-binding protein